MTTEKNKAPDSAPQSSRKTIPIHAEPVGTPFYEARKKIQPRSIQGVFANWRWALVWITQLFFYVTPWLQVHGRQALRIGVHQGVVQHDERGPPGSLEQVGIGHAADQGQLVARAHAELVKGHAQQVIGAAVQAVRQQRTGDLHLRVGPQQRHIGLYAREQRRFKTGQRGRVVTLFAGTRG